MDATHEVPSHATIHPDGMEIWVRDDSAMMISLVTVFPLLAMVGGVLCGLLGFLATTVTASGSLLPTLLVLVTCVLIGLGVAGLFLSILLYKWPMFSKLTIHGGQASTVGWFFGLLYKRRVYELSRAQLSATFNPDSRAGRLSFDCADGRQFSFLLNRAHNGHAHIAWAKFHIDRHLALLETGEEVSKSDQQALHRLSGLEETGG